MPVNLTCACGMTIQVDQHYRGKKAKCPECGNAMFVETQTAIQAERPARRAPAARYQGEVAERSNTGMALLLAGGCGLLMLCSCSISAGIGAWVYVTGVEAERIPIARAELNQGEIITTNSGLKIEELKVGDGRTAKAGCHVVVHYVGTFENGKKFDSSIDRNEPFQFDLGRGKVIKGWDEGVAGMKEGGRRKLIIPSELGYGAGGSPPRIPPHAELVFEVELLKVN